jgi:hypothetical protein
MRRILIACPKGNATGGPEALHQLFNALDGKGYEVSLWDPDPLTDKSEAATDYAVYAPSWTSLPPSTGDILVIPEVMGNLVPTFYWSCHIIFWWLSVDNFSIANHISLEILRDGFPNAIHCFQSEYAKTHLVEHGIHNPLPLSDYINEDFFAIANNLDKAILPKSSVLIAVNPAKGFDRTSKVLEHIDPDLVIKLEGMTRKQIIAGLISADIYLDLGNHPGMDRIPREAALLSCVVVTNLRGAAGNDVDIPISSMEFKFDDKQKDFDLIIASYLRKIQEDIGFYLNSQNSYRDEVLAGKAKFIREVEVLLNRISKLPSSVDLELVTAPKSSLNYVMEIIEQRDAVIIERDLALNKNREFASSVSWKATAPIRVVGRLMRAFTSQLKSRL